MALLCVTRGAAACRNAAVPAGMTEFDRDALKARAAVLGAKHPRNISNEKLSELVADAEPFEPAVEVEAVDVFPAPAPLADLPKKPPFEPAPPAPAVPLLDDRPAPHLSLADHGNRHITLVIAEGTEQRDINAALDTHIIEVPGVGKWQVAAITLSAAPVQPRRVTFTTRIRLDG